LNLVNKYKNNLNRLGKYKKLQASLTINYKFILVSLLLFLLYITIFDVPFSVEYCIDNDSYSVKSIIE
jgi:hypothetical protein